MVLNVKVKLHYLKFSILKWAFWFENRVFECISNVFILFGLATMVVGFLSIFCLKGCQKCMYIWSVVAFVYLAHVNISTFKDLSFSPGKKLWQLDLKSILPISAGNLFWPPDVF